MVSYGFEMILKNDIFKLRIYIKDRELSTSNIIETPVSVIGATQKEELNEKLAEFASDVDNLEEVFENREQIEISRYFERLPKSTTVASEELVNDELFFRNPEEEEEDLNLD